MKTKAKERKLNSKARDKNPNNLSLEWKRRTKEGCEETNERNVYTPFPEELC